MTPEEFRKHAHELVDWMAGYMENVEKYPVKSPVKPGEIFNRLPDNPPLKPESFNLFMKDFEEIIMPGITHWQSPNFFAYFPANTSPPSILAEMIISTISAQCMIWETSPAAAELEEKMMIWLRDLIQLALRIRRSDPGYSLHINTCCNYLQPGKKQQVLIIMKRAAVRFRYSKGILFRPGTFLSGKSCKDQRHR